MLQNILLATLFVSAAYSAPANDFGDIVSGGENVNDESSLMGIVPGFSSRIMMEPYFHNNHDEHMKNEIETSFSDIESYHSTLFPNGYITKSMAFNIYDESMKEAAINLFRLLKITEGKQYSDLLEWAKKHINDELLDYVFRLLSIYDAKMGMREIEPPFIKNPNYFVNGETIVKALKIKANNGKFSQEEADILGLSRNGNVVTIDANYTGWNSANNECKNILNYFREDVGLNSYYYGIHLLFPYWMTNQQMDEYDRIVESYFYAHQQLLARYNLELYPHQQYDPLSVSSISEDCANFYNPSLMYKTGLPFPIRTPDNRGWTEDRITLEHIHISIRECLARRQLCMGGGECLNITEDNHIDLLTKLIRANLDGPKTARLPRNVYGYGGTRFPSGYNPTPSLLHHPETTLRDPIYWHLMGEMLKHVYDFQKNLEPYDMSQYETEELMLFDANIPDITTYFENYRFSISNAITNDFDESDSQLVYTARQQRLNHLPFNITFTVMSKKEDDVVVRIFLGPECDRSSCWEKYHQFFQLDMYRIKVNTGSNLVQWSLRSSRMFSYTDFYNLDKLTETEQAFDIFKFPGNLVIPKGLEAGVTLSLFIMVTPADKLMEDPPRFIYIADKKPFGFPFHQLAYIDSNSTSYNYKFYKINIFHKKRILMDMMNTFAV